MKLSAFLPSDTTTTLCGIYPSELKTHVHTKNLQVNIIPCIHSCQKLEAIKMPPGRNCRARIQWDSIQCEQVSSQAPERHGRNLTTVCKGQEPV